jgi:predicted RNase H-like nuclease (RuvC/YqgF family)
MRILIYVLPVVILLSCESKEVVNNSVELDKEISNRYERLRYYDKVTNQLDFGPSHNINKIDSLFSLIGNLPENQENLKMLNNKLEQLESIYHINLLNIRSFQGSDLIVKMNKILILDAILNEKMQVALFKPRVELV